MLSADRVVALVALLAALVLIGRGLPARRWPVIVAVTLALIVAVVLLEQSGLWPRGWVVR